MKQVYIALPAPLNAGPDADLLQIFAAVLKRKSLVAGITVLFVILGLVYALTATPIYRADVLLLPVSEDPRSSSLSRLSGLAGLAGLSLGGNQSTVRSLAMLRSKQLLEEFIEEKQLLPVLFPHLWNEAEGKWVDAEHPDIRDGVKFFSENVRFITEDRQTGLVTLSVEWTDPEIAAQWAAELVASINESVRAADIEEAQRKLDYLSEQLQRAPLYEARQAIARVMEEQVNALMLAKGQADYAFKVIDPPKPPKERSKPKRTLIVVVAAVLGGLVGLISAVILGGLDRRRADHP